MKPIARIANMAKYDIDIGEFADPSVENEYPPTGAETGTEWTVIVAVLDWLVLDKMSVTLR